MPPVVQAALFPITQKISVLENTAYKQYTAEEHCGLFLVSQWRSVALFCNLPSPAFVSQWLLYSRRLGHSTSEKHQRCSLQHEANSFCPPQHRGRISKLNMLISTRYLSTHTYYQNFHLLIQNDMFNIRVIENKLSMLCMQITPLNEMLESCPCCKNFQCSAEMVRKSQNRYIVTGKYGNGGSTNWYHVSCASIRYSSKCLNTRAAALPTVYTWSTCTRTCVVQSTDKSLIREFVSWLTTFPAFRQISSSCRASLTEAIQQSSHQHLRYTLSVHRRNVQYKLWLLTSRDGRISTTFQ